MVTRGIPPPLRGPPPFGKGGTGQGQGANKEENIQSRIDCGKEIVKSSISSRAEAADFRALRSFLLSPKNIFKVEDKIKTQTNIPPNSNALSEINESTLPKWGT